MTPLLMEGSEREPHDYWPDPDLRRQMHTDPMCRLCGQPRNAVIHDTEEEENE